MDNSFFILSKQQITVSSLEICTWDFDNDDNGFIEMGMEIDGNGNDRLEMLLSLPFISMGGSVSDLFGVISHDDKTSRFVFNDRVKASAPIEGDRNKGVDITFEQYGSLTLLPVTEIKTNTSGQFVSFVCTIPPSSAPRIYMRILIRTNMPTISNVHKGISKSTYLYDIKINEKRNLPDNIYRIVGQDYKICPVKECTCMHIVPKLYDIAFVDGNMLTNIRTLEEQFFTIFLPKAKGLNTDAYMIITNRSSGNEGHTFFTVFAKEAIGTKQVFFAIGANMLCSVLFAIGAIRNTITSEIRLLQQIPLEYWIALGMLITVVAVFFGGRIKIPWFRGRKLTIKL